MSEKVLRLGIKSEPGYLYWLRGEEVWRNSLGGKPEKVVAPSFVREEGWFYFLDSDGDVSRAPRAVSPTRVQPPTKPIEMSLAQEILAIRRPDASEPVEPYLRLADRLQRGVGHP